MDRLIIVALLHLLQQVQDRLRRFGAARIGSWIEDSVFFALQKSYGDGFIHAIYSP